MQSSELNFSQVETFNGHGLNPNENSSVRSAISERIQQIYGNDSPSSTEFISPSNKHIKLSEKIGSGFIGVLYKMNPPDSDGETRANTAATTANQASVKCAKLIDLKTLLKNIEDVNGLPDTLTGKIRLTNLFTDRSSGSVLVAKYLLLYRHFLDFVSRLELQPRNHLPSHPNVVFYEQVLIHDGKCFNAQAGIKRTFKHLRQVNRHQLPSLIMLIMPHAKMSLRWAILNEWSHFSDSTVIQWGQQIGDGLCYLHQTIGMAHLNLKPENILLYSVKESSDGDCDVKQVPLHSLYLAKISDCACSLLLPTASKVLSPSYETSVFVLSPPFAHKFGGAKFEDSLHYDAYCFAMTLLLMLVGYESFSRSFIWPQFPTGLLSNARNPLVEAIETHRGVPKTFANLFKQVFDKSGLRITVAEMLKHEAFKNAI